MGKKRKRVPARAADTRLITPYTSYLLCGYQWVWFSSWSSPQPRGQSWTASDGL